MTAPAAGDPGPALHADALSRLRAWAPPAGPSAERQTALRDRFVAHLERHADGLTRDCLPAHVTAGTLVLSATGDAALLNLHGKARQWFHFGGHCEPEDTTLASAALREATEESGCADLRLDPVPIHLDEHVVRFCGRSGEVHHLDVRFAAVAPDGAGHAASEESLDVRWWPLAGLPELPEEMQTLIAAARTRLFG